MRRRVVASVSGVAALGLAAGLAVTMSTGGAASAQTFDVKLTATCTIPVAGKEQYTAELTASLPDVIHVGDTLGLQNPTITIGINPATTDALITLGATTLEGTLSATATLTKATPTDQSISVNVAPTAIPQDYDANGNAQAFNITATGVSPTATASEAGVATLTAGTIAASFDPKNASGASVLPVAKRNIPCAIDPGQNLVLGTATILPAVTSTPTPTSVPATPKPTAVPTSVPATPKPTAVPTSVPATPKPTSVPATPKPTAVPTSVPATPKPTSVPATPKPTAVPTSVPATPTPKPGTPTATPAPTLTHLNFTANGSISIPTVASTGNVGPGLVSTDVNLRGGAFTGTTTLPNITLQGKVFGFIPITTVASFSQVGLLTGQLAPGATDLTADLKANIGIVSVKALGLLPLTSGSCHTATPVSIHLVSDGNGTFSPFSGGHVSSTFAIGPVTDCGLLTGVLNAIFPGPNNKLSLDLVSQDS